VQAALGKMHGPAMKKTLQLGTKEGGKVLKKTVQAEAPKGATGRLRRSVSARTVRRNRPGTVIAPRPKVAFYRHFVIGGTGQPGPTKPNPFVSRGFDRGQAAAMAALEKVVDDYLDSL
jgi:Bacteriophage HK97-gp10, putative tail-component